MDPALREQLRAAEEVDPDRIVEAVIRLARPGVEIPDVRLVARFGDEIATCRIPAAAVVAARAHPAVVSLKAARLLSPGAAPATATAGPIRHTDMRRPSGLEPTGAGVVVGAADWGIDVDCAAFRQPSGATRLLALWDQRGDGGPEPYGYGTVHDRPAIDAALRGPRPYEHMGFHPAIADRGSGAHGPHVLDIAAGNGRGGGPVGLAPEADLVFVHLADRGTGGLANLGDSVRLLEAVDFMRRTAGDRPWVINVSVGRCGGPHDGRSLAELAFDALLDEAPGRLIVQSAGNYYRARTHTAGRVRAGETRSFTFVSRLGDATPNELEIWYDGRDVFDVRIDPPGSVPSRPVPLGERAEPFRGGRIYHRTDPTGSNHVDAFLDPAGRSGAWTVTIEGRRVVNGRFDAWLERDDACPRCQPRFSRADSVPTGSTGTIANGHVPLVVGACDGHDPARPAARFSSVGPTRDGRVKPDCAAAGVGVLAARSAAAGTTRNAGLLVRKSGTSMAAPHVTGAVSLGLQLAGHRLTARQLRAAVLDSCDPPRRPDPERRLGHGYLNVPRLLATMRRAGAPAGKESTMDTEFLGAAPATAYREFLYRPDGLVARWIGDRYDVVARPNHPPSRAPAAGDVIIEVTLGSSGPGRSAVLDDVTADRFAALRRLPAGRLVLRPRPLPFLPPDEEDEADPPAHVALAREAWTRLFGKDPVLSKVLILDMTQVPAKAVKKEHYDGWTNSATRVYVAPGIAADPLTLEVGLRHEVRHVRQFAATGRPRTYARMMKYEREAFEEMVEWLSRRSADPVRDRLLASAKTYRDRFRKEIQRVARNFTREEDIEREYRTFLEGDYLPKHATIDDLYDPKGDLRNPDAQESVDDAEFSGPEHKAIGDTGSGNETTTISYGNPPRPLTFGDLLSLAGDYFESYEQMRDLAASEAGRAELDWARWRCLDMKRAGVPEPQVCESVKEGVRQRYLQLADQNYAHFSAGGTAWQTYSQWHSRAIADALEAGRTGDDRIWRRALTKEAFSAHFLTDMFAAGHVRTPRVEIEDWYRQHLPGSDQFVEYMAKFLYGRLDASHRLPTLLSWFGCVTRWYMQRVIRDIGGEAVRSFSLGDIVSRGLHDHDNRRLKVVSEVGPDGRPVAGGCFWTAVGDGHLGSAAGATTKAMATAALIGSLRDLERARGVGVRQGNAAVSSGRKATEIREALGPGGFAARAFVPRADPRAGANPALPSGSGTGAPLDWRWGQLGPAAYDAVDQAVKGQIVEDLRDLTKNVKDVMSAGGIEIRGVRAAIDALAQHLADDGIRALEKAVGKPARR